MATGPITEEVELLLFDAVLHLAARAVNLVVEPLGFALQAGDQVRGVGAVRIMLGFGDDAPLAIPRVRLVLKLPKEPHFLLGFLMLSFGVGLQLGRQRIKPLVFGQAHQVID